MRNVLKNLVCASIALIPSISGAEVFRDAFLNPDSDAKPSVYLEIMNDNFSREGIKKDIEWLSYVGVGDVKVFCVSCVIPRGPQEMLSDAWYDSIAALSDAARANNIRVYWHNCPGFSSSGGKWISPEKSMKILSSKEIQVEGGKKISVELPKPNKNKNYSEDAFVIAYRTPENALGQEAMIDAMKLSSSSVKVDDIGRGKKGAVLSADKEHQILIELDGEQSIRGIELLFERNANGFMRLEASQDGENFKQIFSSNVFFWEDGLPIFSRNIPDTNCKFLRLTLKTSWQASLKEIRPLKVKKLENWQQKAGVHLVNDKYATLARSKENFSAADAIDPASVIDLTKFFDGKTLTWNAPKGNWTIARFSYTTTLAEVHPAPRAGAGLEADKFDPEALKFHWQNYVETIVERIGKNNFNFFTDSYEGRSSNWTKAMPEHFKKSQGYDIAKYLPTLMGSIVGNGDESEKFLWDFRVVLNELMVNYYKTMNELSHKEGGRFWTEPYGNGHVRFMDIAEHVDEIGGETWPGRPNLMVDKITSSAGNLFNFKRIGTEMYTVETAKKAGWKYTPYMLKETGDLGFSRGINQFVIHQSTHQPLDNFYPGFVFGFHGLDFTRTLTWARQAKDWIKYITRTSAALQQGRHAYDFLIFNGDEVDAGFGYAFHPQIENGYDYEFCPNSIFMKLKVQGCNLIAPNGQVFKALIMPSWNLANLKTLNKLKELLSSGATAFAPKPSKGLGLGDDDEKVRKLADEIWGKENSESGKKIFGKGTLYWGKDTRKLIDDLGLVCDVSSPDGEASRPPISDYLKTPQRFAFNHRVDADGNDLYFIANLTDSLMEGEFEFRVSGKTPEYWNNETGEILKLGYYSDNGKTTKVNLALNPKQSGFVYFKNGKGTHIKKVLKDGAEAADARATDLVFDGKSLNFKTREGGIYKFVFDGGKMLEAKLAGGGREIALSPNWRVKFESPVEETFELDMRELKSWTDFDEEKIKYFSGSATYSCEFDFDGNLDGSSRWILDLGKVEQFEDLSLNGENFETLWKPPFELDVTKFLKKGKNALSIKVTNTWQNRLIGDENYPPIFDFAEGANAFLIQKNEKGQTIGHACHMDMPDGVYTPLKTPTKRKLKSLYKYYEKGDALQPSGLLGGIKLRELKVMELK